jgi:MGT family glycosyltransferase
MARFLFTVWPYPGCMFPHIAVANALRSRGHEVAFYTGTRAQKLIEGEHFRFVPFAPSLDERTNALLLSPDGISKAWPYPWRRIPLLREFLLDTVPEQVADLDAVLDDWHPDAIIHEPAMYAPLLILHEARRIPVALLEYSFSSLPGVGIPPMGLKLPRPHNVPTHLLAWGGQRLLDLVTASLRRSASALRRRYGLPPLPGTILELTRRLPLTLVPSCPEFDYDRKDLPASVKYIGACQWYPSSEPSEWLVHLPQDRPWVHATEGTLYVQSPRVLRAAAQGLRGLNMQVIITTGRQREPNSIRLGPLASNIVVEPWVSYPDLLPKTDLIVTIGGGGTVLAALAAGIPMVVVPTIWDHPENSQRVVEAGAGVELSPQRCTPRRLRQAVEQVLGDPTYRENAQRLARCLQRYGGPAQGAELLEELVRTERITSGLPAGVPR